MAIKLAFWDMDHTVINNDCDVSWKGFLVGQGIAPASDQAVADQFYQDYLNNELDFLAFVDFQLREFIGRTPAEMAKICQRHFEGVVVETIYEEARTEIRLQQAAGVEVVLLTATNREIAAPLASNLGIETILATQLELVDGCFTGKISGIYCCAEGKAQILAGYANERGIDLADCAYYGDSTADVPVLQSVGHPHAVNPSEQLRKTAETNNWPILAYN